MIDILLVEDDEGDAFFLEEALEKTGFESRLHHCMDGLEAQEFLRDSSNPRPAFILLDLNMPRMNGFEMLKWIKSDDDLRDIPVGILTTSSSLDDINESYRNYASYYITKPTSFEDMQLVIKRIDDFWINTVKLPS